LKTSLSFLLQVLILPTLL